MAKSGQEVIYEGWLTKSPPTKRVWRARWRRRWFSLKHSGEIPNQFILTYYADRNCRKSKGFINLDDCEQVDLGLKLDERKLKFDHVFDIKTPTRTYYLAADSENEMKSWVNCICKVCGLKSTNEEEDIQMPESNIDLDISYCEESNDKQISASIEAPPISRVSTGPYIPISQCFTWTEPASTNEKLQDIRRNIRHLLLKENDDSAQINQTYGVSERNDLNYYVNQLPDPRFYDCPRVLSPSNQNRESIIKENHSPLQSPTDSMSVFTDDDIGDFDVQVTQCFTKGSAANKIPPRPPKSALVAPAYINLDVESPTQNETDEEKSQKQKPEPQKIITDDMYDFPRSHQKEDEVFNMIRSRHNYNNAPSAKVEGQIFRYDISDRPSTSDNHVFSFDSDDLQGEPASPISQGSSTTVYSNLPSPQLGDSQLMPPPIVNRELKPKRKLSDSLSSCSNPEPSSPRAAPSVDRKLKPPTPLQESRMRKTFTDDSRSVKASPTLSLTRKTLSVDEDRRKMGGPSPTFVHCRKKSDDEGRKIRAAPSPTPPALGRSHESLLSQSHEEPIYLAPKMEYLDLDLECGSGSFSGTTMSAVPSKSSSANTVYKKVDFEKTHAFNITRNNLEKERKEPVTFSKK